MNLEFSAQIDSSLVRVLNLLQPVCGFQSSNLAKPESLGSGSCGRPMRTFMYEHNRALWTTSTIGQEVARRRDAKTAVKRRMRTRSATVTGVDAISALSRECWLTID